MDRARESWVYESSCTGRGAERVYKMKREKERERGRAGSVRVARMEEGLGNRRQTKKERARSVRAARLEGEVGGWGRVPFSRNFMKPTPRREWYLTTGRRFH